MQSPQFHGYFYTMLGKINSVLHLNLQATYCIHKKKYSNKRERLGKYVKWNICFNHWCSYPRFQKNDIEMICNANMNEKRFDSVAI